MTAAIILTIAIVALAVAILLSARMLCAAISAASREMTTALRTQGGGTVARVTVKSEAPIVGPTFDGDASEELLQLHQMRYESSDWHVEAMIDDNVDLQDDATEMTEALKRVRGKHG